jgi:polysaccharide export outer membrane protein
MAERRRARLVAALCAVLVLCIGGSGCNPQLVNPPNPPLPPNSLPRELDKASLPPYVIEPPDLLTIDALRVVPKPPYHLEPLDAVFLSVAGLDPQYPIEKGIYQIEPDGTLNLGVQYGKVFVAGMTIEQIRLAIEQFLKDQQVAKPLVNVSLYQTRAFQQIRGEHLVRLDGTISLGTYGSVYVTGMTIDDARKAIQDQLANYLLNPEVSVDILAYNSKVFYIVFQAAANGDQVYRLPITGNETVLDALSNVGGLAVQASNRHIWIARPSPATSGCGDQILPVDWKAIVQCGKTNTNYQILPGDRIYVKAQPLIKFDTMLGLLMAPVERVFGEALLGQDTILNFRSGGFNTGTTVP